MEPLPPTPYNVILMDDNMPNMNGSEAVEIIRQYGYRGLIVGISGDVDPACIERFKKKGVDDVMSKPIDVDKLKMNIEQFLRSQNHHIAVTTMS
jgi:CheY-like chemotaxis protein